MLSSAARFKMLALVGLGSYCVMLRPPFFGSLALGPDPAPSTMRFIYDALTILAGVILLVGSSSFRNSVFSKNRRIVGVLGVSAAVGILLIAAGNAFAVTSLAYYVFAIFLLCVGFAALTASWFHQLSRLPRKDVAPLTLAAFVASHIFGVLDVLPRVEASAISAVYPIASIAALALCARTEAGGMPSVAKGSVPSSERHSGFFRRLRLFALLFIYLEVLCGAFLRSCYARGGVEYQVGDWTFLTYMVSAVIGIVLFAVACRAKTAAEGTLAIGGAGLVGFVLLAVSFSALPMQYLVPLVTGLYSALIVYMMALIELWKSDGDRTSATCAGTFLVLYAAASAITATVLPTLLSYQRSMPQEYYAPVGVAAGLAIALGVCVVLLSMVSIQRESFLEATRLVREARANVNASAAGASIAEPEFDADYLHELAVHRIAERFGLTERERQTAALIAKGYTTKRAAEELVVAASTVQGYCKSIYRKMGIHRKDELIDAVNHAKSELGKDEAA